MTATVTSVPSPRVAPSPRPEHDTPRDVSRNPWVQRPDPRTLKNVFGIELQPLDVELPARRPSPARAA